MDDGNRLIAHNRIKKIVKYLWYLLKGMPGFYENKPDGQDSEQSLFHPGSYRNCLNRCGRAQFLPALFQPHADL